MKNELFDKHIQTPDLHMAECCYCSVADLVAVLAVIGLWPSNFV